MSSTEVNVMPKRQKIAKFRFQILVDNSKEFPKHTHFFKIKEKKTKLRYSKVGTVPNLMIDIMADGIRWREWGPTWRQMKMLFLSVLPVWERSIMVNWTCFCLQEDDRKLRTRTGLPSRYVSSAISYWPLALSHWLLAIGHWPLSIGHQSSAIDHRPSTISNFTPWYGMYSDSNRYDRPWQVQKKFLNAR